MSIAPYLVALLGLTGMVGCSSNDGGTAQKVTVSSTEDACVVGADEVPVGEVAFEVTNDGGLTTEFYLYGADGEEIVSEVENIGPGLTRTMTATLEAGDYITACKPGMEGDGIRAPFVVSE